MASIAPNTSLGVAGVVKNMSKLNYYSQHFQFTLGGTCMARVTSDGQTRASTTSLLMSRTSHLRDLCQTGCDVMSVLVSQEADVLLANLAYGHDRNNMDK